MKLSQLHANIRKSYLDAAERMIQADKSDPFARARIMTHLRNGVGIHLDNHGVPLSPAYNAEEYQETRQLPSRTLPNGDVVEGEKYQVRAFRNRSRA